MATQQGRLRRIGSGSIQSAGRGEGDRIVVLEIPWTSLLVFLGLAVMADLLVALTPSAWAAEVNALSAIAYE
jgi:putative ABC transport system permease protein